MTSAVQCRRCGSHRATNSLTTLTLALFAFLKVLVDKLLAHSITFFFSKTERKQFKLSHFLAIKVRTAQKNSRFYIFVDVQMNCKQNITVWLHLLVDRLVLCGLRSVISHLGLKEKH